MGHSVTVAVGVPGSSTPTTQGGTSLRERDHTWLEVPRTSRLLSGHGPVPEDGTTAGDQGPLRDDLITYLLATSEKRARIIGELMWRNRRMADLLMELEGDDDCGLGAKIELLQGQSR